MGKVRKLGAVICASFGLLLCPPAISAQALQGDVVYFLEQAKDLAPKAKSIYDAVRRNSPLSASQRLSYVQLISAMSINLSNSNVQIANAQLGLSQDMLANFQRTGFDDVGMLGSYKALFLVSALVQSIARVLSGLSGYLLYDSRVAPNDSLYAQITDLAEYELEQEYGILISNF